MEVLDPEHSGINLFDNNWKIYSRNSGMTGHKISASADVHDSMITDGCRIKGTVKHSVLFAGVKVAEGAVVEDAVVMGKTVIKAGAVVEHCIVAENVVIGGKCRCWIHAEGGRTRRCDDRFRNHHRKGRKDRPDAMVNKNVEDGEEQW